jgi:hypothetical protein
MPLKIPMIAATARSQSKTKKYFTTEAQRHREKHFVMLTAPVAQLTKYKTLCLCGELFLYLFF